MAERFSGKAPFPRRGSYGSNRRGLVGNAPPRSVLESQLIQSRLDKQKQIDNFRTRRAERFPKKAPEVSGKKTVDLGNRELAAYQKKQEFIGSVIDNKVTIWTGQTGTGKSTQGVQFLIEAGFEHVFAVVPRKIIADNLGDRIREELAEYYGADADGMIDIIHSERSERSGSSVATVLTAQTLMRMERSIREKYVGKRIAFFNDEVHELDLHTEMAVATSAIYVNDNPESRLILASATMDEPFVQATYQKLNDSKPVPIVNIPGRPHSMVTIERPDLSAMEAYVEYGDVEKMMTFTRGEKQLEHFIKMTTRLLEEREKGSSRVVEFRKLIGTLTSKARTHVFTDEVAEGSRLSIASSPAGMSGITNPGNKGVITDGIINRKVLDSYGVEGLKSHYASKAEIMQMFGRAGRDVEGGFGVLVQPITVGDDLLRARGVEIDTPELEFKSFNDRDEYPPAQIYHSNLSRVALEAAGLHKRLTDLNPFFQHKVTTEDVLKAEKNLAHLGALDDEYKITQLGEAMDLFPLSPELARGLVEATQTGRTLLHMARSVLIASAIDAGGLQDFNKSDTRQWDKLVRPSSKDDFIAQLDIMTQLQSEDDLERAAYEYDLQPNKVEQVSKTTKKIFRILNIRPDDIVFGAVKPDEEGLLRDDFTSGMIDLVYEKSSKQRKVQQYIHILGNEGSTQRQISDRSVAAEGDHEYIAGFPRWYIPRNRQGEVKQIIDRTLIVKPEVVVKFAARVPSMLSVEQLGPRMDGGRVVEQEQLKFGPIAVGDPTPRKHGEIPDASRKLLMGRVLSNQGIGQEALRAIASTLEWFNKAIPQEELAALRSPTAPDPITDESITALIWDKTAMDRDVHVIDERLIEHIYSKNISIHQYYTPEVLDDLLKRSPKTVIIGKQTVDVHYDNGQPYITKIGVTQKQPPLSDFYLPDGREILIQKPNSQSRGGITRISAKDLISE